MKKYQFLGDMLSPLNPLANLFKIFQVGQGVRGTACLPQGVRGDMLSPQIDPSFY